jgi:hypothetical protein
MLCFVLQEAAVNAIAAVIVNKKTFFKFANLPKAPLKPEHNFVKDCVEKHIQLLEQAVQQNHKKDYDNRTQRGQGQIRHNQPETQPVGLIHSEDQD